MTVRASRLTSGRPPAAALVAVVAFLLLVPLWQWIQVELRDWGYGGSPAAELDAPYFWALVLLRSMGAVLLGGLLLFVRKPAAVWVAVTATWLAGPPLTFLFVGVGVLAASQAQRSLPDQWTFLAPACAFPLLVTLCLLGPRRVRQHYRL